MRTRSCTQNGRRLHPAPGKEPLCALVPALWETFFNARCNIVAKGTVQAHQEKIWSLTKFALGLAQYFFMLKQLSKP